MSQPTYDDRGREPSEADLAEALGRSFGCWQQLLADLSAAHAPLTATWKYPGKKYGWTLKRKSRSVFYMTPHRKHFMASTAFGEKAVAVAQESGLPEETLNLTAEAPRFAEGRAIRLEIRKKADLPTVLRLAEIKMSI